MSPGTPVQQYKEQAWSQGYHLVNPYTQSGFQLYRELMPPTQPVNLVSQTTPVAPGDSVQRNVLSGQFYQQQYLLYPQSSSLTRPANGPTDSQNPSHSEPATNAPFFQQAQAVLLPLVNQQPLPDPVSDPPPTMQQHGGVAQDSSSMRPVSCSQSCPPGSGNCCFQLAFHEHHHHIVPGWPGNAPFIYTGLPSLTQVASPPVPPLASPARNGEQTQPPGGSPATQTEQPNPVPVVADRSNLFYWLTASQMSNQGKPYRIQPSHLGQMPRYVDVQSLTQLSRGQNADPLLKVHNWAPSEASRLQLSRPPIPRYTMNPILYSSPPVNSPQLLYSNVPHQTSRTLGSPFQKVVQYVPQSPVSRPLQHEPADPAQRDSGQRPLSFQPLPKGF